MQITFIQTKILWSVMIPQYSEISNYGKYKVLLQIIKLFSKNNYSHKNII